MTLKLKICVLLLALMVASFEVEGGRLFKRGDSQDENFFFPFPVFFLSECVYFAWPQ
jgi:hypothetical protein